jgi:alpha-1,6-mannosyltransferase
LEEGWRLGEGQTLAKVGATLACFPFFRMKICDATQFYSEVGGGVRRYLTEKRRYILQHTQDEHVLLIPGERTEVIREGRLTTCTVRSPRVSPSSRYRILFNLRQAAEFIRQEKPDLIEAGDPYHLGWRMIEVGRELGIPVVGFYHSHFPEAYLRTSLKYCGPWVRDAVLAYAQDYIERLYNEFDFTLVPSEFLVKLLRSWGVMTAVPVRLGVDTTVFRPGPKDEALRAAWGAEAGREVLLYVGRLAGEKNTPVLLETFRRLEREHPGRFVFVIVGDGGMRSEVAALRASLPRVHWTPYCADSEELARHYRSADLFVHPGVCETFGLVTLESQACGCPVVGIRGTYMDALIRAGLEHWAASNDAASLARAILSMSAAGAAALGATAGMRVREEYAWEKVLGHLWGIYRRASEINAAQRRHGALHGGFELW